MNKLNVKKNEDKDDEYKDDNSQSLKSDESLINKNEEEELFTYRLMLVNFPIKVINYVIGTISLCEQKMIKYGK